MAEADEAVADPAGRAAQALQHYKGETLHNYRARLRHKNGSFQSMLIVASVLFNNDGNFVHTRCFTVLAPTNV
jgi:hypothetical protein